MAKYRNDDRYAAEDAELELLEKEYREKYTDKPLGEPATPLEPLAKDPDILQEEETWKKRHSDLRSYTQKQINEKDKELLALKAEIDRVAKEQVNKDLPKNREELQDWVKEYPDLARVLGTMIDERAGARVESVSEEVNAVKLELSSERQAMAKERAFHEVLKVHPDFAELIHTEDFKEWVIKQPLSKTEGGRGSVIGQAIYSALYENDTDSEAAIQAVDVYKADKASAKRSTPQKDAALTVKRASPGVPASEGGKRTWKESEIESLAYYDWDKYEADIDEARREGRIIYDVTGAAR